MTFKPFLVSLPIFVLTVLGLGSLVPADAGQNKPSAPASQGELKLALPFGLDEGAIAIPADNPLTKGKVELGRLLFFDKRLSKNNTIACASCHMTQFAFTDGKPVSAGIHGLKGGRSAPASLNRLFSKAQFWDGRASTLEEQSVGPLINPIEHGFANHDEMVAKMKKIPGYRKLFKDVFGTDVTTEGVGMAIARCQRTIRSGNSPADRFDLGGDA